MAAPVSFLLMVASLDPRSQRHFQSQFPSVLAWTWSLAVGLAERSLVAITRYQIQSTMPSLKMPFLCHASVHAKSCEIKEAAD